MASGTVDFAAMSLRKLRNLWFILVSAIAWLMALNLFEFLLDHRLPLRIPVGQFEQYYLPIFHLLPWFAGIRWILRIRKRLAVRAIDAPTADLAHTIVVELLVATYIVLDLIEALAISSYHHSVLPN
jgi:hypothetical protein